MVYWDGVARPGDQIDLNLDPRQSFRLLSIPFDGNCTQEVPMTIETETLLSNLTVGEKLAAMDLLWRDLSRTPSAYASPDWHGPVLADRLANPADGVKTDACQPLGPLGTARGFPAGLL